MSGPERSTSTVRVRRVPKVGVFLALGAGAGAVVALVATLTAPADPRYPLPQVLGFLILLLAPVGALVGGTAAVLLDAALGRRSREVEAHRESIAPVPAEPDGEPTDRPEEL